MQPSMKLGEKTLSAENHLCKEKHNADAYCHNRKIFCDSMEEIEEYQNHAHKNADFADHEISGIRRQSALVRNSHNEIEQHQGSRCSRKHITDTPSAPACQVIPQNTENHGNNRFIKNILRNILALFETDIDDNPRADNTECQRNIDSEMRNKQFVDNIHHKYSENRRKRGYFKDQMIGYLYGNFRKLIIAFCFRCMIEFLPAQRTALSVSGQIYAA